MDIREDTDPDLDPVIRDISKIIFKNLCIPFKNTSYTWNFHYLMIHDTIQFLKD